MRSDLLPHRTLEAEPIPSEAPAGFFDKDIVNIKDIGQPVTAGFVTDSHMDPTNW